MKEFKINDLLTVKLEDNKTIIYVSNMKILHCKYLLLNDTEASDKTEKILSEKSSIDTQSENLNHSLELVDENNIPPEVEFWAHSSNLQAWYEHDYDTNILHSNLAFPLLKKLSQAGDFTAKQVFKKEIITRFRDGNLNVMTFLVIEGFLDELSIEDSDDLYQELDLETYKKLLKRLQETEKREVFID